MSKHLEQDLGRLQQDISSLADAVEQAIRKTILALQQRDVVLAQR